MHPPVPVIVEADLRYDHHRELRSALIELALKQRTMGEQIPRSYLELESLVQKKKQDLLVRADHICQVGNLTYLLDRRPRGRQRCLTVSTA